MQAAAEGNAMKAIEVNQVVLVGVLAATLSVVVVAEAAEIRFRAQARCEGAVVRLGDVADIISADKREREALQAIELGPAGPSVLALSAREVQDRLAAQGVKLVNHEISGASAISVVPNTDQRARIEKRPLSKSAINLAKTAVAEAIATYLHRIADGDEEWIVEADITSEDARTIGADCHQLNVSGGRPPWTGTQRFTVNVVNGNTRAPVTIAAEVKRSPRAVVTVNAIARGERIRREDVQLERVKAGSAQQFAFQSIDQVVGKEAARNIAAGQALDNQYIRAPILVRRGDVVDLYARSGGVRVSTKARARDAGSHGDLIDVELLTDRRHLLARVCGIQEVEILAAAPSVETEP
jgi:flagellar basal body P-ring formation protein FlgA